jgi:hypothetical protein
MLDFLVKPRVTSSANPFNNHRMQVTVQSRHETINVRLLPLPQPQLGAHGRTDKSKRTESQSTKECARVCVLCIREEPKYYYCPITLVMT